MGVYYFLRGEDGTLLAGAAEPGPPRIGHLFSKIFRNRQKSFFLSIRTFQVNIIPRSRRLLVRGYFNGENRVIM